MNVIPAPQQTNLYHPAWRPERDRWSLGLFFAVIGAIALMLLVGGLWAYRTCALQSAVNDGLRSEIASLETGLASKRPQAAARQKALDAEIAVLQAKVDTQRLILGEAGLIAGGDQPSGHASLLAALAAATSAVATDPSRPEVWITAIEISGDGRTMTLTGRMTQARAIGSYIDRLQAQPRLAGMRFERLAIESSNAGPQTTAPLSTAMRSPGIETFEFTLRGAAQ